MCGRFEGCPRGRWDSDAFKIAGVEGKLTL
jgi:hypothetical protein